MFNCDYKQQDNRQFFILSGKLDQESFADLDKFIQQKYVSSSDVVVNTESLDYISSVGLRCFIALAKLVREDKKNIYIKAKKNSMVYELIRLSGFTRIMPFI